MQPVRCYLDGKHVPFASDEAMNEAVTAAHAAGSAWCIEISSSTTPPLHARFGNDARLVRHDPTRPVGPDLLKLVGRPT